MASKTALITGIAGQDGQYLAELLLEKRYRVCGTTRRPAADERPRLGLLAERVELHHADLLDTTSVERLMECVQPDEVYNLAAPSFVPASWDHPIETGEFAALGVTRLLEALRRFCPEARFFQASSSEMYGKARTAPQSEETPYHPRTPYGVAKVYGHHITVNYREGRGLFACSGILFNHESPRRGPEFVTRKITRGAARIRRGLDRELRLGNLQSRRDWGFAGDYVRAMWLMLQREQADDYVIGSGEAHSVEEFVASAFTHVGLDWRDHVVSDPSLYRPAEAEILLADASKARRQLSWQPEVSFADMVAAMVDHDLALLDADARRTA